MVGVVGSSPIAPTKYGSGIKHLAAAPGAFFLSVRKKYGKAGCRREPKRHTCGPADRNCSARPTARPSFAGANGVKTALPPSVGTPYSGQVTRGKALAPRVKREVIERLCSEHGLSERRACRLVGLARDSYRHPPEVDRISADLSNKIVEIAHTRRRFGYRRIHDLLRPEYPGVNHKCLYRLYSAATWAMPAPMMQAPTIRTGGSCTWMTADMFTAVEGSGAAGPRRSCGADRLPSGACVRAATPLPGSSMCATSAGCRSGSSARYRRARAW
jgi:HTH-like domain